MTSKGAYEAILTELRKAKAPSLHLEDYVYFINKGVQEYVNERYNKFQISQQITDDLSFLITSDTFVPFVNSPNTLGSYSSDLAKGVVITTGKKYNSSYISFNAPFNYWHMAGCHVISYTKVPTKCEPAGTEYYIPSKKLSAHTANAIISNAYLKPSADRVYHDFTDSNSNIPKLTYYFGEAKKYGIKQIVIDYLKKPNTILLTKAQADAITDNSGVLEFPEYVANEIVKRAVKLILENSSDPRVQSHIPINQTIV